MDKVKKFLVTLMCLAALLGAVCVTASAAKDTRVQDLILSTQESYTASLAYSQKESFHGHCGNMTSWQLYYLGINDWFVSYNGNEQFDYYANKNVSSGGYYITPYYIEDYSLEQALNHLCRNGTRDVYNILVGFQQTTTEDGSQYGHAVLINGILDGKVYFVESFDLSLNGFHEEGSVITCSVAEFARYYEKWATYEGLVCFGSGQYADACTAYETDLMIQARFETTLRSQPNVVGKKGCKALRSVLCGERLRAEAVYEDPAGDRYYRVKDGENIGYIAETAMFVLRCNPEDLSVQELNIPQRIARGGALKMAGTVVADKTRVSAVEITVTDMQGQQLLSARQECYAIRQELSKLSLRLDTQYLPEGAYLVQVFGECAMAVPGVQEVQIQNPRVRLGAQMLLVGKSAYDGEIQPVLRKTVQQLRNGWVWEDARWYCYENGNLRTGWVQCGDAWYYLGQDGAAVTGWQTVDGQLRLFRENGAMAVSTTARLDGKRYTIDESGVATR